VFGLCLREGAKEVEGGVLGLLIGGAGVGEGLGFEAWHGIDGWGGVGLILVRCQRKKAGLTYGSQTSAGEMRRGVYPFR
jgi:hypothetical protein